MEDIHNVRFPLKGLLSYAFEARTQFDEKILRLFICEVLVLLQSLVGGMKLSC